MAKNKKTTTDNFEDKLEKFEEVEKFEDGDYEGADVGYNPGDRLTFPEHLVQQFAEKGMRLKWIRFRIGDGSLDTKNIRYRLSRQEGYSFVDPAELDVSDLISLGDTESLNGTGVITNGDLVAMKVRAEKAEARTKYYQEQTRNQARAAEEQLRRNNIAFGDTKSYSRTGKNAHYMG